MPTPTDMNKEFKVLLVDDEQNILQSFQRTLRNDYLIDTASDGQKALELINSQGPYAVVVSDMRMPGMNGIQLLQMIKKVSPSTQRVMLTGNCDQKTATDAINGGSIFRFLNKPCSCEDLSTVIEAGFEQYKLVNAERDLLHNTLGGSIKVLTDILSMIDPESFGHALVYKKFALAYAAELKITSPWDIGLAAMLANIGYATVPVETMAKFRRAVRLNPAEEDVIRQSVEVGSRLLANIPRLEKVAGIVLYQNKNYDGSGFPEGKHHAAEDIPLGARILKLVKDLVDLESKGIERKTSFNTLKTSAGKYDPKLLALGYEFLESVQKEAAGSKRVETTVADLIPGQLLVSNVQTEEGLILATIGRTLTDTMIEKIRNYKALVGVVEPIYVDNLDPLQ